ncbi:VWA domain-containing protein [Limnothrix sp. FACHB-1083]|uniref:vWA domain-containing protein n=1 Tax=unclassified Limnothrix TaxID=2632864 RepID=UPI001680B551|nr:MULTISPECIES: VWA domain-containing protein [unclassified Limnothrix]MBD2159677.1 VWA domain-containing protein [Limnothrix sp. FACHB-1083]MBD2190379.1 VWA domain-containing protein [Limnothrix sp. FACHB-1088]
MPALVQCALSDANLDAKLARNQRQLAISVAAQAGHGRVRSNLCLILDRSGSMRGRPMEMVKAAARQLVGQLALGDRLSLVAFDHEAQVILPCQEVAPEPLSILQAIEGLAAGGGTCIDEGLKLGIEELARSRKESGLLGNVNADHSGILPTAPSVSQIFLLTDGENEHGNDPRCLKMAELAASYGISVHCLGFGSHWNQDTLEQIADAGAGALCYIEQPEDAPAAFERLLARVQSVQLTNARLLLALESPVRLAELKPIAQVAPETVELTAQELPDGRLEVRLGDLMVDGPRVVLVNAYVAQLPPGDHRLVQVQVCYDDPATGQVDLLSEPISVIGRSLELFHPAPNAPVQAHIGALAKYRQTQIAETKLQTGDRQGAVTMLQAAAQTALQMGDRNAATVLQTQATKLQAGDDLSEADRKKTRIASKTTLR